MLHKSLKRTNTRINLSHSLIALCPVTSHSVGARSLRRAMGIPAAVINAGRRDGGHLPFSVFHSPPRTGWVQRVIDAQTTTRDIRVGANGLSDLYHDSTPMALNRVPAHASPIPR